LITRRFDLEVLPESPSATPGSRAWRAAMGDLTRALDLVH